MSSSLLVRSNEARDLDLPRLRYFLLLRPGLGLAIRAAAAVAMPIPWSAWPQERGDFSPARARRSIPSAAVAAGAVVSSLPEGPPSDFSDAPRLRWLLLRTGLGLVLRATAAVTMPMPRSARSRERGDLSPDRARESNPSAASLPEGPPSDFSDAQGGAVTSSCCPRSGRTPKA